MEGGSDSSGQSEDDPTPVFKESLTQGIQIPSISWPQYDKQSARKYRRNTEFSKAITARQVTPVPEREQSKKELKEKQLQSYSRIPGYEEKHHGLPITFQSQRENVSETGTKIKDVS